MCDENSSYIFVVDDEPAIVETLATILKVSGFSAKPFLNALDALAEIAETSCPALVLTDINMPHMSGIDLGIRVREVCPRCKVVLFSGRICPPQMLEIAQRAGYDFPIIEKPIHPTKLIEEVKSLVAGLWHSPIA
jgi:FixJ family two-component response regulator